MSTTNDIRFSVEQTKALCGGKLPYAHGFAWHEVEYFLLENGVLEPYSGNQILPGPGLEITIREIQL